MKNILPKSEPQTEVKPPNLEYWISLSGQSELLVKEEGRKQEQPRMEYNGEQIQVCCWWLRSRTRSPAPGGNVSYRLWNLWSKEKPSSNIRMIVRSKVAGFQSPVWAHVPSVKLSIRLGWGRHEHRVPVRAGVDRQRHQARATVRSRINPATGDICMLSLSVSSS